MDKSSSQNKSFVSGISIYAIYLDEREWIGKDANTIGIDDDLYKHLKDFLEDYFCRNIPEDKITQLDKNAPEVDTLWHTSLFNALTNKTSTEVIKLDEDSEEKIRVIPGGRYGCS